MDVNIIDKSNWEKILEVAVSSEELTSDFEKAYREYKKNIKLGGFRKGKVPISLIKKMFSKEIETQAAKDKIPGILADIQKENKLKPISQAKVEEYSYNTEDGLKFKVFLEVVPKIELQNYKGLLLEREEYQVEEEDVKEALEYLRGQHAIIKNIEQEAQIGHYIIADFQKLDPTGLPIVGEKYENRFFQLEKNDSGTEKGLTNQLIGVKAGETRQVKFTFTDPQNQQQIDNYSITVKEVKEQELPDLDDEFAKDVGDFENLEDLKVKLKQNLEIKFKNDYEQIFSQKIIDDLVKINQFELPEPMISNYLEILIKKLKEESKDQKIDEQQLRVNYRSDAVLRLKWLLIKDKLCELEGIQVTDSEIDEYIENLAKNNDKNSIEIKSFYRNKENREQLNDELLDKKVIKFLAEHADIKEKKVSRRDIKKESKIIV